MKLCPLFSNPCKGQECAFWLQNSCVVVKALAAYVDDYDPEGDSLQKADGQDKPNEVLKHFSPEELAEQMFTFVKSYDSRDSFFDAIDAFKDHLGINDECDDLSQRDLRVLRRAEQLTRKRMDDELSHKVTSILAEEEEPRVVNWLMEYARENSPKNLNDFLRYRHRFLEEQGLREWNLPRSATHVLLSAVKAAQQLWLKEEMDRVEKLSRDAFDWMTTMRHRRFSKEDVKSFLAEKGITLLRESDNIFYNRVNQLAKSARNGT